MGLDVEVGIFSSIDQRDRELFENLFVDLNKFLVTRGLQPHIEPTTCSAKSFDMYGYIGFYYLRRLAAHLDMRSKLPAPVPREGFKTPVSDPAIEEYLKSVTALKIPGFLDIFLWKTPRQRNFDHILLHSDCEGFYIPQRFEAVLFSQPPLSVAGGAVGSSYQLLAECKRIASALELKLDLETDASELYEEASDGLDVKVKWHPYAIEAMTCMQLYQAADHSIKTGAAVVFA